MSTCKYSLACPYNFYLYIRIFNESIYRIKLTDPRFRILRNIREHRMIKPRRKTALPCYGGRIQQTGCASSTRSYTSPLLHPHSLGTHGKLSSPYLLPQLSASYYIKTFEQFPFSSAVPTQIRIHFTEKLQSRCGNKLSKLNFDNK